MDERSESSGLFKAALGLTVVTLLLAGSITLGGWIYLRRHEAYERALAEEARMVAEREWLDRLENDPEFAAEIEAAKRRGD